MSAGPEVHEPTSTTAPVAGRRRRRFTRPIAYAASLALIGWAALVTPLPYVEFVPGTPTAIEPLIAMRGTETTPLDGETLLLTIVVQDVTPVRWVGARLDPRRVVHPAHEFAPRGGLTEDFFARERQRFAQQFEVATAVGAEAAGTEVSLRTSVLLVDVVDGSPAAGLLHPGDEVVAFDGERVSSGEQLQALTRARDDGDVVAVRVRHGGVTRTVEVELRELAATGHVGLGVLVETVAAGLDLPFEVELGSTRIGGPSAGLMIALTVYDLLAEEDLLAGRTVAGTGSVDAEGTIGRVGGVAEKAVAAARYDVDLLLVPAGQLAEARRTAPPDLTVVGVDSFDQALEALRHR